MANIDNNMNQSRIDPIHNKKDHAPSVRIIKRYSNRKLYDVKSSKYITLHDIASLYLNDETISIIDNTTGEDISPMVLAQATVAQEKSSFKDPFNKLHTLTGWAEKNWQSIQQVILKMKNNGLILSNTLELDNRLTAIEKRLQTLENTINKRKRS